MYILFEGIDGVGKSTQIELLSAKYQNPIITKEPGGTEFGVHVREILLGGKFKLSPRAEALMFLADRAEHYAKVVAPNANKIVISDRGFISGIAYALANENSYDAKILLEFNKFALNSNLPDKVVFFEADKELLEQRLLSRGGSDAVEARGFEYLLLVQQNMKNLLLDLNLNTLYIDASKSVQEISKEIEEFIQF
ncbi:dTMP kinase [Campylobacter sp. RM9344]|uniref:Thymidylate kinase n=1 Tax=Campylobacter californiensis TaxID=1032243 RepID=A0AAW3ZXH6_9BACT|nr:MULTISPECIES: dTMP kinase [unclassified Campylobacter]MBE2984258.1 dTMP kinase [Campylobacter sp. RM6883]MBE2985987.1 dTMP kinase [Campylobacter sp. RM12919]MBE2988333.1 dTMP kinase [Campylobacter sp. RM12920]MBE2994875.1 dTMP kinase [Campylobacter sp. RM6913]MBE3021352.1 dTMP kinase [Campylobacter sp. 7477a]MBE3029487.1 dTMP kinase [Campylobacter sp. RM9344]